MPQWRVASTLKLPRAVFRYIEHELYNYDLTKKELEEIRQEIISLSSSPGFVTVGGTGISDDTGRKAVRLITNAAIARMARTLAAIDRALMRLADHHRQLFDLKYQKGLPWQEICMRMHIERSTYFKYREELVHMVALEMGLLKNVA